MSDKGLNNKDTNNEQNSPAFVAKVEKKMEEGYRFQQALAIILEDDKPGKGK